MTSTLIDTNVFLDVIEERPGWFPWSMRRLHEARREGPVVVNPIVFAEASIPYEEEPQFAKFVEAAGFVQEDLPFACAFQAGKAHLEYRRRGGVRASTLPDFFIGAHALLNGYRVLSRDVGRFRTYFTNLDIIAPDTHP